MCNIALTREDVLTERLFNSTIQSLELFSVYLGKTLGLYKALHRHGPLTPVELAEAAAVAPRYAREWLEQQAVAGFLLAAPADEADHRRFSLPGEHVGVLADEDHSAHVAPFAQLVAAAAGVLPQVAEAYRTGAGVPYSAYGTDFRNGQGAINRPAYLTDLTSSWLPSIPDLHRRMSETPGARIADLGCGQGWSTIALTKAYPQAKVTGFDLDEASIVDARNNAEAQGIQVDFVAGDAADVPEHEHYDLILLLECLHDMSYPTRVLAALRRVLKPGGSVVIADEKVAERFAAPGDEIERMMYGWSVAHCLPVSMVEEDSEATGTVMRPETVRRYSENAGFTSYEVLPIDNELFRFYRLSC